MSPRPNNAVVPIKMREDMLEDPFFSCNWSDFDAHRTGLMKKSGTDFWDQVEKDMGKFESSLAAMERDMERRMGPMRGNVPDWAIPEDHRDNWPVSLPDQPDMELTGFRSQKIKDTDHSWTLEVDVGEYDPEGVKLSVAGDIVIIRAGKSTLEMKPNNQSSFSSSIERRFTLPRGCNTDRLTSRLTPQNLLIVECPRTLYLEGPSARSIKSYHYSSR